MKKFFKEFKTFITRGNVIDLAVGVIVGSAFTAIVTAVTQKVLMPIINLFLVFITGSSSLEGVYSFLKYVPNDAGTGADLTKSIFIDWGALIIAIINFLLIAFILFLIVKAVNKMQTANNDIIKNIKKKHLSKMERKELKARGIKLFDKKAIEEFLKEKELNKKIEEEKLLKEKEEKEKLERLQNPTTEDLLKDIKDLLVKQMESK